MVDLEPGAAAIVVATHLANPCQSRHATTLVDGAELVEINSLAHGTPD
jgi:hypothetical protein